MADAKLRLAAIGVLAVIKLHVRDPATVSELPFDNDFFIEDLGEIRTGDLTEQIGLLGDVNDHLIAASRLRGAGGRHLHRRNKALDLGLERAALQRPEEVELRDRDEQSQDRNHNDQLNERETARPYTGRANVNGASARCPY